MIKLLFKPFGIVGGILAGIVGKKAFEGLWHAVDDQEAPEPQHRDVPWYKLLAALALQGAVFSAARGLFDHGARRVFRRLTGRWPGEERPEG